MAKKLKGYSIVSILVFLLILLIVFNFERFFLSVKPDITFGNMSLKEVYSIKKDNFEIEKNFFVLSHGYMELRKNQIIYINKDFNKVWSKEITGENIEIISKGSSIYVINMKLGDIFKIDYNGAIEKKIFSQGAIEKIIDYDDKFLSIVTKDDKIIKYNRNLEKILEKSLDLDHLIMIKENSDSYYSLNIEDKNNIYFTRLVQLTDKLDIFSNVNIKNEIFYRLDFQEDSKILSGSKKIIKYNKKDELVWKVALDYLLNAIHVSKDEIYVNLIGKEKLGEEYNFIKVYNSEGIITKSVESPIDNIIQIIEKNKKLYIISDRKLVVLDEDLKIIFSKEFGGYIEKIDLLNDNKILINMKDKIKIYSINF